MLFKKELFSHILLFFLISSIVYAAGGGGGGGSSSGLGFGSRDSIFILISQDYSKKFSLKNGTKYDFKVDVKDNNVTVNFGSFSFNLEEGDNYIDLNDNNLADINFNLVKVSGKRADIRIINAKDLIAITSEEPEIIIQEPEPAEEEQELQEQERGLRCGNLPTLKERVSCRLELEEEEQEEELELYYLPEECGALTGSVRGICIARYKSVQTCWKFPIGNERISCVKRQINLDNIQEEKEECNALTGEEKSICVRELKNKVYDLIKWRFYDLEERAEDFMARGLANKESVVEFVSKIEENKIKFNEVGTKEERRNIILDVRNDWQEFVNIVRGNLSG